MLVYARVEAGLQGSPVAVLKWPLLTGSASGPGHRIVVRGPRHQKARKPGLREPVLCASKPLQTFGRIRLFP